MAQNNEFVDSSNRHNPRQQGSGEAYAKWQSSGMPGDNPYGTPSHGKPPIPTWGWAIIVSVPVAVIAIVAILFGPNGQSNADAPSSVTSTPSSSRTTASSSTTSSTVWTNESNYVSDPLVLVDLSIAYCFDLSFEHRYSEDNIFDICVDLTKEAIKHNEPTFDEIVDKNGEVKLDDVEDVLGDPTDFMAQHGYKPSN